MKLTGVVYTTNKKLWVEKNLKDIYPVLKRVPGLDVSNLRVEEISLSYLVPIPVREEGGGVRIEWDWLVNTYPTDGNILCLHITKDERDRIGLKHPVPGKNLGGSYNRNIGDDSMEFVVIADTSSAFKRVFLHELAHGFSHWTGVPDNTHKNDYELGNIELSYKSFSFSKWNLLSSTVVLLKTQLALMLSSQKAVPRTTKTYPPTQDYGERNPIYSRTGRHIGVDYACPVGTPVVAPLDGEVLAANFSEDLGYNCQFIYTYKGATYVDRLMHLNALPTNGKVKRGAVIAYSGNTGKSTGPHLHVDTWVGAVALNKINATNWDTLTVHPEHLYR